MIRQRCGTDLAHPFERRVARRRVEEEAQAVLRQVTVVEVARKPEAADEIVARDLNRRLADLERGLGRALKQADRQLRRRATQLTREQRAGETAADDRDV